MKKQHLLFFVSLFLNSICVGQSLIENLYSLDKNQFASALEEVHKLDFEKRTTVILKLVDNLKNDDLDFIEKTSRILTQLFLNKKDIKPIVKSLLEINDIEDLFIKREIRPKRYAVATGILSLGGIKEFIPILTKILEDESDWFIRACAIKALAMNVKTSKEEVVLIFVKYSLEKDNPSKIANLALRELKEEIIPILSKQLHSSEDYKFNLKVIAHLCFLGAKLEEIAPIFLKNFAHYKDEDLKLSILYNLCEAKIATQQVLKALMSLLEHKKPKVRIYAVALLPKFGRDAKEAIPILLKQFKKSKNIEFLSMIINSIGHITDKEEAVSLLTQLLCDNASLNTQIGYAFGIHCKEVKFPILIQCLRDAGDYRKKILNGIFRGFGEEKAKQFAYEMLSVVEDKKEKTDFRLFVLTILMQLEKEVSIPIFKRLQKDENDEIRQISIRFLKKEDKKGR